MIVKVKFDFNRHNIEKAVHVIKQQNSEITWPSERDE